MVEDAPAQPPVAINFRDLFLSQEQDDEDNASLGDALSALAGKWPEAGRFQASGVARSLNDRSEYQIDVDKERAAILRDFMFPKLPPNQDVSAKAVGKVVKRHVGEPVLAAGVTLILKEWRDPRGGPSGALSYYVQGG